MLASFIIFLSCIFQRCFWLVRIQHDHFNTLPVTTNVIMTHRGCTPIVGHRTSLFDGEAQMQRFALEFKQKVAEQYLEGKLSLVSVAELHATITESCSIGFFCSVRHKC